jgi:hypothetical protein
VETFLNKILSDAKKQTASESQLLENKSELFDLMYETIESNSETLSQVKDLVRNVRVETKDIQPIKETMEKTEDWETIFGASKFGGKEHYGIKHQIITPVYVSELVGGKLVNRGTMMPTLP